MTDSRPTIGEADNAFRTGFVAVLGRPNAGKSTLVNALVGQKLCAVSGLPQTTRDRINVIWSDDAMQAVFVDLPGLVEGTDKLNEALRRNVLDGIEGVDCVLHLVDTTDPRPVDEDIVALVLATTRPVLGVASKIDTRSPDFDAGAWFGQLAGGVPASHYAARLGVSATTGVGLQKLRDTVFKFLPVGPPLFDPEQLTDRNLRFLAAELIREKVFHFTHQEIPYATAVTIEAFEERARGKTYIAATIHIERDSQKGIIIGRGGAVLKRISQAARRDIEALLDAGVFLDLHVKVSPDWRKKDYFLREFGYGR
ncbi:MAG: GTPase Era [Candidatus Sumerlaeia bacterium]|nr:GTPase Era [Candidatus Sumerlaeia bacterium]